jgi:hypothetical protein
MCVCACVCVCEGTARIFRTASPQWSRSDLTGKDFKFPSKCISSTAPLTVSVGQNPFPGTIIRLLWYPEVQIKSNRKHVVAQAVSRQPLGADAQVQFQASPCGEFC